MPYVADVYRQMRAEQAQGLREQVEATKVAVEPPKAPAAISEAEEATEAPENIGATPEDRRKGPRAGRVWVDKHGRLYKGHVTAERVVEDNDLDQIKQQGQQQIDAAKAEAAKAKMQKKVAAVQQKAQSDEATTA